MEYWIDGYNVILRKRWNANRTLEQAREHLLSAALALGVPVRVYFDASKAPGGIGPAHSRSSRVVPVFVTGGTADDAMAEALRGARGGRGVIAGADGGAADGAVDPCGLGGGALRLRVAPGRAWRRLWARVRRCAALTVVEAAAGRRRGIF